MEYRVLGPLEVFENGNPLALGGPRQKAVLADLLIHRNEIVTTDRLIEDLWGDEPPQGARNTLQSYVSNLRRVLGEGRIEGRSPGYVLKVDHDEVDAARFRALVQEAHESLTSDAQRSTALLRDALALWRGPPFADLADEPSLQPEVARLEELQRSATEDRVEAELRLGHHDRLVAELEVLVEVNSLRERLWAQLMLALYRSGRQAEALSAYDRLRKTLVDELGIDPSPDVQRLHEQILRQDPSIAAATRQLLGYSLLEEMGAGGYGVVYRALQPQVGREVAVKVVHPRLANDPGFVRRFEAEAQMVARLEHPHIVPLYDYWREPDGAFLVMRLLRGGNLRTRIDERAFEPRSVAELLDQIASALAAAHRQGIVHRDVKPANILLDEDGNAYLSDFGIALDLARPDGDEPTPWTTGYLSPEQIRGETPTHRADLYSLGVVLFEALTGRRPFDVAAPERLAQRHLSEPLPRAHDLVPNLPSSLDEVIQTATAKDPEQRYSDALAMAEDFRRAVGGRIASQAPPALEARNPYKGLRPFHEADAADFFGREALVEQLLARVSEPTFRFLAVVGPSGSGKSSVVRAGLIPALRGPAVAEMRDWFVVEMFPGAHPFREFADALTKVAVERPENLVDELEVDDRGLIEAVRRMLPDRSGLVLVIDQLEEAFTLVEDEDRRDRFLRSLVVAATEPGSPIRIVVTLRADFYDRPLRYRRLGELIRAGTEVVLPLAKDELERAVARPAERAGARCEATLVTEIVADVADQPGALPLLQYTLTELFARRKNHTLTLDSYRAIGGVSGSLVKRAEDIYAGLDEEEKEALRQVFLRLVTLGEGVQDTRRRVPRSELISLEGRAEGAGRVIDAFGRVRLLSFDRDPQTREPTVEVAHESLLTAWGRLQGWIDSARDDVRMHRGLAAATGEWGTADRDPSFLLRGGRLERFEAWAATSELALARLERQYLDASIAAREEEVAAERERREREENVRRRSIRRLRALVGVLAVASIVAALLTLFALDQRGRARDEATRAERETRVATARELAAASRATVDVDPDLAIALAVRAVETSRERDGTVLREAEEALHEAIGASRVMFRLRGLRGVAFSPDGRLIATSPREGITLFSAEEGTEILTLPVRGPATLAFSPDSDLLAVGGPGSEATVWRTDTGTRAATLSADDQVEAVTFSPDGRLVAALTLEPAAVAWDVESRDEVMRVPAGGGVGLAFTPDGEGLSVPLGSGTVTYEIPSGERRSRFSGDGRNVVHSPEGTVVATAGLNGVASVWDAQSARRLHPLVGHDGHVNAVAFRPDGKTVATGGDDGIARVWDPATGDEMLAITGQQAKIEFLAFSPDGSRLASGGSTGTLVWDLTPQGTREVFTIPAHTASVFNVVYSSDGSRIATAGEDGVAAVWDPETGERFFELTSHDGPVSDVVFSRDDQLLATSSFDGTAKLWDAKSGEEIRTFRGHEASAWAVSFSPDATRLVTVSEDGTGRVWDVATGEEVATLRGHTDFVYDAAFSPDGSLVASVSNDFTARLWDPASGDEVTTLEGHAENIVEQAFSPDGSRVATASFDGTAKVWSIETGQEVLSLRGHGGIVIDVEFSPDGKKLATAGADGTIRLWDADTGNEILTLASFAAARLAFNPDGTRLVAGGLDGMVRAYTLDVDELLRLAKKRATRDLTDAECRQYLHLGRCPTA